MKLSLEIRSNLQIRARGAQQKRPRKHVSGGHRFFIESADAETCRNSFAKWKSALKPFALEFTYIVEMPKSLSRYASANENAFLKSKSANILIGVSRDWR